jgi:general secretion pathway protein B
MSYILDALRKAERERSISQVPTLMTVHDTQEAKPRTRPWLIAGACLVCAAAILVAISLFRHPSPNVQTPAARVDAGNAPQADAETDSAGTKPVQQPETAAQVPAGQQERAIQPVRPANPPARKAVDEARHPADVPTQQQKVPVQPQPKPASAPVEKSAAGDAAQSKEMSLREAMAKMKISILLYDESKSERMVFINDRKYLEGDYVDGRYLVENITLDGVILSFQGERLLLRPAAK